MYRRGLFISILLLAFLFTGCAGVQKCMDGTYDRQIKDLGTANAELRKEVIKLDGINKNNEKALTDKQSEVAKLEEDKTALTNQIKGLNEEIQKLKAPRALEPSAEQQKPKKAEMSPQTLRIKILAGSGQLSRARAMSSRLIALGYKVEKVDRAPRTYAQTTVFYSADSEGEAKNIAKRFGAEIKPISWKSVFNIIIAVGGPHQQPVSKPKKAASKPTKEKAQPEQKEKQPAAEQNEKE